MNRNRLELGPRDCRLDCRAERVLDDHPWRQIQEIVEHVLMKLYQAEFNRLLLNIKIETKNCDLRSPWSSASPLKNDRDRDSGSMFLKYTLSLLPILSLMKPAILAQCLVDSGASSMIGGKFWSEKREINGHFDRCEQEAHYGQRNLTLARNFTR